MNYIKLTPLHFNQLWPKMWVKVVQMKNLFIRFLCYFDTQTNPNECKIDPLNYLFCTGCCFCISIVCQWISWMHMYAAATAENLYARQKPISTIFAVRNAAVNLHTVKTAGNFLWSATHSTPSSVPRTALQAGIKP